MMSALAAYGCVSALCLARLWRSDPDKLPGWQGWAIFAMLAVVGPIVALVEAVDATAIRRLFIEQGDQDGGAE